MRIQGEFGRVPSRSGVSASLLFYNECEILEINGDAIGTFDDVKYRF
jgi:hypothetical protein